MPYVKRTLESLETMKKEELLALAAALDTIVQASWDRAAIIQRIRDNHPDEFE